ncbi:MAG TPA: four-carbon acid sugar kinase family protein [Paludibacter sp.]|nr:four-carbon acid sugar kinase family protein [Paludibacter sp.]
MKFESYHNIENKANFISLPIPESYRDGTGKVGVLIIADDITGAAEIAGVCLRYGLKVSFGIDAIPADDTDVKIIATDSRSAIEGDAFQIYQIIANEIFKDSKPFVFKKCDSALRGFILTELSALTDASGLHTVILQPSNPLSGRSIKNGEYFIGDNKIENTGFSFDPDFPTSESSVKNILLSRSTRQNTLKKIHFGKINKISEPGVYIPDCSSIEDLIKSIELADNETLMCGSAAFFEQILIHKGYKANSIANNQINLPTEFLLISGSTHPESRIFVEKMKNNNFPVRTFPESLLQEKTDEKDIEEWVNELSEIWNKNNTLILTPSVSNITFPDSSTILSERMALVVQKLLDNCKIREILLSGGATSYTLLKELNWKTLKPVQELAPGVVRMKVQHTETYLTLKPGSYPWPEEFLNEKC